MVRGKSGEGERDGGPAVGEGGDARARSVFTARVPPPLDVGGEDGRGTGRRGRCRPRVSQERTDRHRRPSAPCLSISGARARAGATAVGACAPHHLRFRSFTSCECVDLSSFVYVATLPLLALPVRGRLGKKEEEAAGVGERDGRAGEGGEGVSLRPLQRDS